MITLTATIFSGEKTINIDKKNMTSLSFSVQDRQDFSLPSFGIISNGGSVSFKDKNGEVFSIESRSFKNSEVKIYLNDTLEKTSDLAGIYYVTQTDYDYNNRSVQISFQDNLQELQDMYLPQGVEYDFENNSTKTLADFYKLLYDQTPLKYNFLGFDELDPLTKSRLERTVIKYPYLNIDTIWSCWQKLCDAALLTIYQEKGKTICKYGVYG